MKTIAATIIEQGNGFPGVGSYVQGDGSLYRVASTGGTIHVGDVRGNTISAELVRADWRDCAEVDVHGAKIIISESK